MSGTRKLSDTQVPPGWGVLCSLCRHTWPDEDKYVSFPPESPCNKLKFDRGGYDRSTFPPRHIAPAPIFELARFSDGTESCPSFQSAEGVVVSIKEATP